MSVQTRAIFGLFENPEHVSRAVSDLKTSGFRNSDISVLFPYNDDTRTFAHEKHTKAPEGAVAGGGTGLVLGGVLGWLVGLGVLAIPGLGPFIAAGPIMAALAGAGVGGTVGSLTGALIGLGVPEYEAKAYETYVKQGGILVSVHVDDSTWAGKARSIMEDAGASDADLVREAEPPIESAPRRSPTL